MPSIYDEGNFGNGAKHSEFEKNIWPMFYVVTRPELAAYILLIIIGTFWGLLSENFANKVNKHKVSLKNPLEFVRQK